MTVPTLDRFSGYLRQSERRELTIQTYRRDLDRFARWYGESNGEPLDPARVTSVDLREYKMWLTRHEGLGPATVNRRLATLRSFLRWAGEAGLLPNGLPRPPRFERQPRGGPKWLSEAESNRLLRTVEQAGSTRDLAIVTILLNTGVRVSELCALTWADVSLTERKGTLLIRDGKGGRRRRVPLNLDARVAFQSLGYARRAGEPELVFVGQRGHLTQRGVQLMLARYAKLAGIQASPHTLRHTFCKNLVNAGVSLQEVAALAGHENLETTRLYCEPSLTELEHAVEAVASSPTSLFRKG
jgi:integrase/recombinase XerC